MSIKNQILCRLNQCTLATLISLSVLCFNQSNAATIYVKHNASGSNNGTSWTNAYNALQDAINASSAGDEIWVAAGTYKPTRIPSNGNISTTSRDLSFYLDKNIGIYGGFTRKNERKRFISEY